MSKVNRAQMNYLIEVKMHSTSVAYCEQIPSHARKLCTIDGHTFWYTYTAAARRGAVGRARDAMVTALGELNIPRTAAIAWHVGAGKENSESAATREAKKYTKPLL